MDPDIKNLLPYSGRLENLVRYEEGVVFIGDRSKYPFERTFRRCDNLEEVALSIEQMFTQGTGSHIAAAYGFIMAARGLQAQPSNIILEELEKVSQRLINTRPTNTSIVRILTKMMVAAEEILHSDKPLEFSLLEWMHQYIEHMYALTAKQARFGADMIDDGDGIITMCFAEAAFLLSIAFAYHLDGKSIHIYVPETRPYLQGARLTATSLYEMDVPVTLITDNMPAFIMSQGRIQKYLTAADLVTMDGHVTNKIGSFQNALSAHYHGIPYFVLSRGPDPKRSNHKSIVIEERDPTEVRSCRGNPTTLQEIDAFYPAFDITPPHLVAGIITPRGIIAPYDLKRHYCTDSP